jgi:hypothetical protein
MKPTASKSSRKKASPKAEGPAGEISATFDLLKRKNGRRLSIAQIKRATARAWAKTK